MRPIDADALKENLKLPEESGRMGELLGIVIDAVLEDAPTIEERKKGKWIKHETENSRYDDMICPFCRKLYTVDAYRIDDIGFTAEDFNFCPNCGADMREQK